MARRRLAHPTRALVTALAAALAVAVLGILWLTSRRPESFPPAKAELPASLAMNPSAYLPNAAKQLIEPRPVPTPVSTIEPTPLPTSTTTSPRTPTATAVATGTEVATATVVATATPVGTAGIWKMPQAISWQWLIDHALDVNNAKDMGLVDPNGNTLTAPAPQVYDIDGFYNGQDPNCNIKDSTGKCVQGENDAVNQLHAMGKKVVCYIDAGVYEDYRPDAYKFPASVIGSADAGWNGSFWLDIRQTNILGPIMKARIQMCKDKGYDAIEPDEIDGYSNDTKFGMTYQDQLNYNRFIAQMAHSVGISIGLKGDIDQVKDLVNDFDWTLNEECSQYGECTLLKPFSNAGKAVLEVEYKGTLSSFCPTANTNNWNAMLMLLNLDSGRQPCR